MIGQRRDLRARAAACIAVLCAAAVTALLATASHEAEGRGALTCFGQAPRGGPTSGDDVIIGTADRDTIATLEGNDRVCARAEGDDIDGNAGIDRLAGEGGNDEVSGGTSGDFLRGSFDDDLLLGNEGNDELRGGRGDDALNGGSGEDVCLGGPGVDIFIACEEVSDPDQPGADIPDTIITKQPKRKTAKAKSVFKFKAEPPRSTFQCKLDKRDWRKCKSPYRRLAKVGRHRFKVRAIDREGDLDPSPAVRRWRVVSRPRH